MGDVQVFDQGQITENINQNISENKTENKMRNILADIPKEDLKNINTNENLNKVPVSKEITSEQNLYTEINTVSEKSKDLVKINENRPASVFSEIEVACMERIEAFIKKYENVLSAEKNFRKAKEIWNEIKELSDGNSKGVKINDIVKLSSSIRESIAAELNRMNAITDKKTYDILMETLKATEKITNVWCISTRDVAIKKVGGDKNPEIKNRTYKVLRCIEESSEKFKKRNNRYLDSKELEDKSLSSLIMEVGTDMEGNILYGEEERDKWNKGFVENAREISKAKGNNDTKKLESLKADRFKYLEDAIMEFLRIEDINSEGKISEGWMNKFACGEAEWIYRNHYRLEKLVSMSEGISQIKDKSAEEGSIDKEFFENLSKNNPGLFDVLNKKIEVVKEVKKYNNFVFENHLGISDTGEFVKYNKKNPKPDKQEIIKKAQDIRKNVVTLENDYLNKAKECSEFKTSYEESPGIYKEKETDTLESIQSELKQKREEEKIRGRDEVIEEITRNAQALINILGKNFMATAKNEEFRKAYLEGMQIGYRTLIASCNKFLEGKDGSSQDIVRVNIVERMRALCMNESILMEGMSEQVSNDIKTGELSKEENKEERENLSWRDVLADTRAEKFSDKDKDAKILIGGAGSSDLIVIQKNGQRRFFKKEEFVSWHYSAMKDDVKKGIDKNKSIPKDKKGTYLNYAKDLILAFEEDVKAHRISERDVINILDDIASETNIGSYKPINFLDNISKSFGDNKNCRYRAVIINMLKQEKADIGFVVNMFSGMKRNMHSKAVMMLNGKVPINAKSSAHNVATSRVAKLLGIGGIVAESKTAIISVNGKKYKGNVMEEAKGVEIEGITGASSYSGNAKKQLCNLAVFDYLMGQKDRHTANYLVTKTKTGWFSKIITEIKAIDNDVCCGIETGKELVGYRDVEHYGIRLQNLKDRDGSTLLPFMDNEFADSLLSLRSSDLEFFMLDILSPRQIEAMKERLIYIQDFIKKTRADGSVKYLKTEREWDTLGIENPDDWQKLKNFNGLLFN